MTYNNNNNSQSYGIDKFEGSFDKEESGVTITLNSSINEIRNLEASGLYTYLLSRPRGWKLNVKHLKDHFQCGKEKMYNALNWLLQEGFITCSQNREKGKFAKPHYRVHLTPKKRVDLNLVDFPKNPVDLADFDNLGRTNTGLSPYPALPDTVSPDTVKQDAYKTKILTNKDLNKKPIVDSSKSTKKVKEYKDDDLFMTFYDIYPNKQKPVVAHKAFCKLNPTKEFVLMLVKDVLSRINNNWKEREKSKIPFPASYLNSREWEGEIYKSNELTKRQSTKYKSWDEIIGDCL